MTQIKIVQFDKWCPKCKHEKLNGTEEPCNTCIESGGNENSTKPVCWVKKGKKG